MTETYQSWIERVVGGRSARPLASGEIIKSSSGEPFGVVEFVRISRNNFSAEIAKKGNFYIYHIYPGKNARPDFYSLLSEAFLEVFKREDQIEAEWVDEMKAWAVRVRGWTNHIWGDDLAIRVIEKLDETLTGDR